MQQGAGGWDAYVDDEGGHKKTFGEQINNWYLQHTCQLTRIEYAHSWGIILCDVKPENSGTWTMFRPSSYFDLGLAKLYINSSNSKHIPMRGDWERLGPRTPLYSNANVRFEQSESILNILFVSLSTCINSHITCRPLLRRVHHRYLERLHWLDKC